MAPVSIERWNAAWHVLGLRADASLFGKVVAAYGESHRRYHTLQHLQECLGKLDEMRQEISVPPEIELALWFHDAVYEVTRHDNEERSAAWAAESLHKAGVADDLVQRVHALVMATRHHQAGGDTGTGMLVDIDLSILGAPADRFREYEVQIRDEYRHVPELLFNLKRRQVLAAFLDRPRIFSTHAFNKRYEQQARANLRDSLRRPAIG